VIAKPSKHIDQGREVPKYAIGWLERFAGNGSLQLTSAHALHVSGELGAQCPTTVAGGVAPGQ